MRLKLFRAAHMADAMAQVRAELGPDALILNTRKVAGGIEITAALEPEHEAELVPRTADPTRLAALIWHGVPADLHPALSHGGLEEALARIVPFGTLPLEPHQRPVMLTGPPGAGKTLTTVRLATRLVMAGTMPMVITTDGKRAGATEQLAAFTRLLGVPLLVASHPVSLARALTQRRDGVPVLIDTAGADARDPAQAEELRGLAGTAGGYMTLVLPAGLDPAEAADLALAHAECGAQSLIATRLDLSKRLGGVIAAAVTSQLPLTEAGIGSGAADGLIAFTPALLAERLAYVPPSHAAAPFAPPSAAPSGLPFTAQGPGHVVPAARPGPSALPTPARHPAPVRPAPPPHHSTPPGYPTPPGRPEGKTHDT
jgi:flagellar biosynthesis protein FlhF